MESSNITAENSVGHCWAKSFSYLAHPCQAAPGGLCHLRVSDFRGFVLFGGRPWVGCRGARWGTGRGMV